MIHILLSIISSSTQLSYKFHPPFLSSRSAGIWQGLCRERITNGQTGLKPRRACAISQHFYHAVLRASWNPFSPLFQTCLSPIGNFSTFADCHNYFVRDSHCALKVLVDGCNPQQRTPGQPTKWRTTKWRTVMYRTAIVVLVWGAW